MNRASGRISFVDREICVAHGVEEWVRDDTNKLFSIDLSPYIITHEMSNLFPKARVSIGVNGNTDEAHQDSYAVSNVGFDRSDLASVGVPEFLHARIRRMNGSGGSYSVYLYWSIFALHK